MPTLRRTAAAFAAATVAALTLATPAAMATTDPSTCADALFTLVKVRSSQDNLTHTVTVAEQDDAIAQKQLRDAQHADKDAKAKRDAAIAAAQKTYLDGKPYQATRPVPQLPGETKAQAEARADAAADAKAVDKRNTAIAEANSDYTAGGTGPKLDAAADNARAKRSYLAEVKLDLNRNHDEVVRITLLTGGLCERNTPASTPTTEPAPTTTPDQPPVIIQNNQIGQVPTGVPSGGGSMADILG